MAELTGWLLDLYDDPQGGVVLWLLGDDGERHRLQPALPGHLLCRRRRQAACAPCGASCAEQPQPLKLCPRASAATCSSRSR